ncbi:glycosyltransferase family protein [Pseudodesulfovibrio piezophilus]|nr:DUF3880 domain-containing protein [Pseudodesulfovibrio piezophilus]
MQSQIQSWDKRVPSGFLPLDPQLFTPELAAQSTIIRYRPGLKAFPSFWAPLTARVALGHTILTPQSQIAWLPFAENDLLVRELLHALEARGYTVRTINQEHLERSPGTALPAFMEHETPALFLSVNFKGLDPFGLGFNILREAGVKTGIWLVDNPFNILPSIKSGFWKEVPLFVTDHTFITPLKRAGASEVTHLPLAACPELFSQPGPLPDHGNDLENKLVFVGRSEFPRKQKFFAGLKPPKAQMEQAVSMLSRGERPHFHWWHKQIPSRPWPGNEIRTVGIGAEVTGQRWKLDCLTAAGEETVIFGDDKWRQYSGITNDIRRFLDYYGALPAVYHAAGAILNITGMQLPAGLTQRHFDVWCAGGFLLTDANPGLTIFPDSLTTPITYKVTADIGPLFTTFQKNDSDKITLQDAWKKEIQEHHTYHNRLETLTQALGLP